MKRNFWLVSIAAALSLGLGACGSKDSAPVVSAPEKEVVSVAPAAPKADAVTPVAPSTATEYVIDAEQSTIKYIGSKGIAGLVMDSHPGGWSSFDGSVTVQGDDLSTLQITLNIDMKSIYSDDKDLERKLIEEPGFFEVAKFPAARFVSSAVTKKDAGVEVKGELELHGIKKNVTFPATVIISGKELTAEAEFVINRQDWDINYKQGIEGAANQAIIDEVPISFFVVGKLKA